MNTDRKEERIRVRTARTDFTDSCGEAIRRGEKFVVVEPRAQFYSRKWLSDALVALDTDVRPGAEVVEEKGERS